MANSVKNSKNDHNLWQAFVSSNDAQAQMFFGQVIGQHYKPLLSYGTKLSKDADFVKDCMNDLFINIWQKRQALTDVKSPRFYLLGALRNQILREIQKNKRLRDAAEMEDNYDLDVEFAIEQHIIRQEIEAENHQKIRDLLIKITKRQREAIYLRFYQDLEYTEIAEIMGVATHSVVNLIYEAVKQLRQNWVFDLAFLTLLFA